MFTPFFQNLFCQKSKNIFLISFGPVMVCGCFISTHDENTNFSPVLHWRASWLRHFIDYPFGAFKNFSAVFMAQPKKYLFQHDTIKILLSPTSTLRLFPPFCQPLMQSSTSNGQNTSRFSISGFRGNKKGPNP